MANTTKDSVSTPSPASPSASSEKGDKPPMLADYWNPVWDGPGICGMKKIPPLPDINTENAGE